MDGVWQFQTWAVNAAVGLSCARHDAAEEAWLGNTAFEAKVISEKDADAKRWTVPGLHHVHASEFATRPAERLKVRVGPPSEVPAPLPRSSVRPAPLPRQAVVVQPQPRFMVKVKR